LKFFKPHPSPQVIEQLGRDNSVSKCSALEQELKSNFDVHDSPSQKSAYEKMLRKAATKSEFSDWKAEADKFARTLDWPTEAKMILANDGKKASVLVSVLLTCRRGRRPSCAEPSPSDLSVCAFLNLICLRQLYSFSLRLCDLGLDDNSSRP
jgi:hypothetical protein